MTCPLAGWLISTALFQNRLPDALLRWKLSGLDAVEFHTWPSCSVLELEPSSDESPNWIICQTILQKTGSADQELAEKKIQNDDDVEANLKSTFD